MLASMHSIEPISSALGVNPLVLSKLTPPKPSLFQVLRPALRDRIGRADGQRVVLIRAPAGFGKTTVMLQAMALFQEQGIAVSWLTVDAADNDIGRFLGFLAAAFEPLAGTGADSAPATPGDAGVLALDLMDRIALATKPFVLFIDDLESIQNAAAFALVHQVIENLPGQGRIVMSSRALPPVGIPRLRAKGELLEMDAVELRFTSAESSEFLESKRGLKLQSAQIGRLHRATEGWPLALWLASLALEKHERPAELVDHFSGSNAALADYFAEEVLAGQPEELRAFMLRTSILSQLTPALCDAVRGQEDSRELLERLERANLFVVPLSEDREWFRYHSLFAGFLRAQLERSAPGELAALHRAAASWYEAQRRPVPAIEHALASGDTEYGLRLLAQHAESLLGEGRVRLLAKLLDAVPPQALSSWPKLRLIHVWALAFTRGAHEAMTLLEIIEAENQLEGELQAHALALRPMLLTMMDRFDEACSAACDNLVQLPPTQVFPHSMLRISLAHLYVLHGRHGNARELLDRNPGVPGNPSGPFMLIFSQCVEGVIDLLQGRLRQATARFRLAAGTDSRNLAGLTNGNAMAGILLAEALYEADELSEAERLLNVYVPLMQELGLADHLICGYRNLARIAAHRGDEDRALQIVTDMEGCGHRLGVSRIVASAQLERARLAIARGDIQTARDSLQRARAAEDWTKVMNRALIANDMDTLAEGKLRLSIHSGTAESAVPLLKQELERAENARRHRRALKLRILLALALDRAGNEKAAMRMMRDALKLGAREHFIRAFLNEGPAFQQLLRKISQEDRPEDAARYFERMTISEPVPSASPAQPVTGALVEPLTRKEIEILTLVAEGLSNMGIADRLFVSETTVRTHLRNINTKLHVHNRTQAIATARRFQLIH